MAKILSRADEGTMNREFGDRSEKIRTRVSAYMGGCPVILGTPSTNVGPGSSPAGGVSFRSDGKWIWSDAGGKAFANGRVDLDIDFVRHVLSAGDPPQELSEEVADEVLSTITQATH